MELILREDVQNLGFKDDIVTVKNGYGRNFLIPQGKAVLATSSARKVLAENLKQSAFKEQKLIDDANKIGKALLALEVKIASKVGAAVKIGKEAFYKQLEMPIIQAYEYTGRIMAENMMLRHTEKGIDAFLNKLEPVWEQD